MPQSRLQQSVNSYREVNVQRRDRDVMVMCGAAHAGNMSFTALLAGVEEADAADAAEAAATLPGPPPTV